MKILTIGLLVLLLTSFVGSVEAQTNRRDGNWWRDISEQGRISYVLGMFDGMHLGNNFSYWNMNGKDNPCRGQAMLSFTEMEEKYLTEVTVGQVKDGIDVFYGDYRNRKILTSNAMWIVLNSISGAPQNEIERMTENWRKNSQ